MFIISQWNLLFLKVTLFFLDDDRENATVTAVVTITAAAVLLCTYIFIVHTHY